MIEFHLPSLGADMEEGKLLEWKVAPGQSVKRGDVVAVIDTSKAAVEVEIWESGTVHELLAQPGETYPVGAVLARLLAPGEQPGAAPPAAVAAATPAVPTGAPAPTAAPATAAAPGAAPTLRPRASPSARKRAAELDVALEGVTGTGPGGAITLQDIENAAARAAAKPAAPAKSAALQDRQAEMQRTIAAAMSRSKREIPHYYLSDTVPLGVAADWLARENAARPVTERVLMAALYLKAVASACVRHPDMNGYYVDGRFQPGAAVHLGVAISLRSGGLVAPALLDAQAKSVTELMRELADLVKRTRTGSLRASELSSATITVTNLGDEGVEAVFGVIHPPQVALVGFGRAAERAWGEDGKLSVMRTVTATLAADHRVSNGMRGAQFLAEVKRLLQSPETL
ncbi:MAG: dihydrolipoamide acetyltransferase family protein [Burkholderiales bacterium]